MSTKPPTATAFTYQQLGVDSKPVQILPLRGPGGPPPQVYLQQGVYHVDFNVWPTLTPWQAYPPNYYGGGDTTTSPIIVGGAVKEK